MLSSRVAAGRFAYGVRKNRMSYPRSYRGARQPIAYPAG